MTGDDRIRHCAECQLNVYNLSDMTRAEAEELIARREGRLCVRFFRRADGTIITRDCPRGLRALTNRVSRFAGAVLTAMIAVTPAFTQSRAAADSVNQVATKDRQLGLDVTVVDPTGALIPNAEISLCRCEGRTANDATTDAGGTAHFRNLPKGTYEISVQAPGFRKAEQNVTIKKVVQLKVKLQIAAVTTTVEVKAQPVAVMGTVGVLSVVQSTGLPPMAPSSGRPAPLR
jgi:hypothetical protein